MDSDGEKDKKKKMLRMEQDGAGTTLPPRCRRPHAPTAELLHPEPPPQGLLPGTHMLKSTFEMDFKGG